MERQENARGFAVLRPSEGKALTDGRTVSYAVYAPLGADVSRWREVGADEAAAIEAAEKEASARAAEESLTRVAAGEASACG